MSTSNMSIEKLFNIHKSASFDLDNSIDSIRQLLEYRREIALRILNTNSDNNFDDLIEFFNEINEKIKELLVIDELDL